MRRGEDLTQYEAAKKKEDDRLPAVMIFLIIPVTILGGSMLAGSNLYDRQPAYHCVHYGTVFYGVRKTQA